MTSLPTLQTRHPKGVETAHVVRHQAFQMAHQELTDALRLANAVAIYGPAGTGKSFAVTQVVQRVNAANPEVRTPWVEIPHRPRGKALPVRILTALHGTADDSLTEDELLADTIEALAERTTLLVIDEADHLRTDGLFQVKHIFDQVNFRHRENAANHLGLALVGVDVPATLKDDEQLDSRVATRVKFRPFDDNDLVGVLEAFHAVFEQTDKPLLELLDRQYCKGSFRRWAHVLQRALNPINGDETPDRIDRKLAERLLDRLA